LEARRSTCASPCLLKLGQRPAEGKRGRPALAKKVVARQLWDCDVDPLTGVVIREAEA
jgi:hypothetical protein